jgi:hypothetical protein
MCVDGVRLCSALKKKLRTRALQAGDRGLESRRCLAHIESKRMAHSAAHLGHYPTGLGGT